MTLSPLFLCQTTISNCRTAASIGHHVIWLKFFLMNGFFSLITDKGNLQTRLCRQVISWALLWLWHLFHVIHYNLPNLKIVKVLAIDWKLTWEKNESLTVSSFCRFYRNTVTDITQSKKCMKMSMCTLVRADKGRVTSNHETPLITILFSSTILYHFANNDCL